MNKVMIALAASAALLSTPALAADNDNFTGGRVGVTAGIDNVTGASDTTDIVYGADVGIDFPAGDKVTLGLEAFSTNPLESERTIGAAARIGYALNDTVLVFTRAGYTNYQDVTSRELNGLTAGGGLEFAASRNVYGKVEYRYSDFEAGVGNHGALVGVGIRF